MKAWLPALMLAVAGALAMATLETPDMRRAGQIDMISLVLGESRGALSEKMLETADRYYHGGVQAVAMDSHHGHHDDHDEHEEGGAERQELLSEGSVHHRMSEEHQTDEIGGYRGPAWWRMLYHEVHPSGHKHLTSHSEARELLPWFRVATTIDRENVPAYEVGAFWLARQVSKPEAALKFIDEGLSANPDAFELWHTKGRILKLVGDIRAAVGVFETAAETWVENRRQYERNPKEWPRMRRIPEPLDLAAIYTDLSDCMKRLGNQRESLAFLAKALPYAQGDTRDTIRRRLREGGWTERE